MVRTLGPYELLRPLGQGGMAEVFLARRRISGTVEKRLVIKRIRREHASDPRFVAMFVQEARLSMSLVHKNIVPVFDFGRAGDELFLAMELVDGPDLGKILEHARAHGERLAPMLVAYIALEACQALDYAHGTSDAHGRPRALVHRDVTPGNVLISRAGEIKLVDFGVAAGAAELASGKIRGTPAYMSPEQACGKVVDGRADVFSMGLLMWEALAGRRAYDGRDNARLLEQARAGQVPDLPDDVPGPLGRIVARATAVDLGERFAGARDMQLALDGYLVAARAAAGGAPPSHALAEWLRVHAIEDQGPAERDIEVPAGSVVTFLDDGEEEILGQAGTSTMRSVAETMVESESKPESESEPEPEPESGVRSDAASGTGSSTSAFRRLAPLLTAGLALGAMALGVRLWPDAGDIKPPPAPATPAHMTRSATPSADASAPDAGASISSPAPANPANVATPARPSGVQSPRANPAAGARANPADDTPRGAPPEPAPRTKKRPRADARPAAAPGIIKISATPWARVTVLGSGEQCDETPCVLRLAAGAHTLRLVNPVAGLSKDRTIEIAAGQTLVVRETWTR